jgi:hypothetical protein
VRGRIEDPPEFDPKLPIDALAVGHYIGVEPVRSEGAIDEAISLELRRREQGEKATSGVPKDASAVMPPKVGAASEAERKRNILTQFTARGILVGELARPFFLEDPRPKALEVHRVIAIAGMGPPGRFGLPELIVLARELCWSLGRMQKKHLATVAIGSGDGNIDIEQAVGGFLEGMSQALTTSIDDAFRRLKRITFVELDPLKVEPIEWAIGAAKSRLAGRISIHLESTPDKTLKSLWKNSERELIKRQRDDRLAQRKAHKIGSSGAKNPPRRGDWARISVVFQDGDYRFAVLTDTAVVPERVIKVDGDLIASVNRQLAETTDPVHQREWGQTLGLLLIPDDLRSWLFSHDRVVMILDANTARIHWELVAQTDLDVARSNPGFGVGQLPGTFVPEYFLGTDRSLARQFSSTFGAAPEPPPPPRRVLRVLVVADPSPSDPLAEAEAEGREIVELFDLFNRFSDGDAYSVHVQPLIGPDKAQRADVVREVLTHQYDILHYCGHCFFKPGDPAASGWIFGRKGPDKFEIVSAYELSRIDRVPKFVFSNGCESGVTPERVKDRDRLDPSFAEAFFQKGVANLICTGWPVGDGAARRFALNVYAGLLGLELSWQRDWLGRWDVSRPIDPLTLSRAVQCARKDLAVNGIGKKTWGAYQHYGNPEFQLLDQTKWKITPGAGFRPSRNSGRSGGGAGPQGGNAYDALGVGARGGARTRDQLRRSGTLDEFRKIARTITEHREEIVGLSKYILGVRPGYWFKDGWITQEPALILSVQAGGDGTALVKAVERLGLDVVVDFEPATPLEQVTRGAGTRGLTGDQARILAGRGSAEIELTSAIPGWDLLQPVEGPVDFEEDVSRGITADYIKPAGPEYRLDPVEGVMSIICHASPDDGWPTLRAFLDRTRDRLTVGMYDFTAPHIAGAIEDRMGSPKVTGKLRLNLDPGGPTGARTGGDGPKADDPTEDEILGRLRRGLGAEKLEFCWAAVKHDGRTSGGFFPTAYHIKVAVRDGEAFWLSSGNWQSSNQAPDEARPDGRDGWRRLRSFYGAYNREWHVVIENKALAALFEKYLSYDIEGARQFQAETRGPAPEPLPEVFIPAVEEDVERAVAPIEPIPPRTLTARKVSIRPLLTPDNYAEHVLDLIRGARRSICFQNQYIAISTRDNDARFLALVDALRDKALGRVKVRIILRTLPGSRKVLEALRARGFPMKFGEEPAIKFQSNCHNKGIIVDSRVVLLGSHNWSSSGTTGNRDTSLIIDDTEVARYYEQIFDQDWRLLSREKVIDASTMPVVADRSRGSRGLDIRGFVRSLGDLYED